MSAPGPARWLVTPLAPVHRWLEVAGPPHACWDLDEVGRWLGEQLAPDAEDALILAAQIAALGPRGGTIQLPTDLAIIVVSRLPEDVAG